MLAVLLLSTDKVATVHSLATLYKCSYNIRTQSLAITNNSIFGLLTQVVNKINSIIDALQLIEQLIHLIK